MYFSRPIDRDKPEAIGRSVNPRTSRKEAFRGYQTPAQVRDRLRQTDVCVMARFAESATRLDADVRPAANYSGETGRPPVVKCA